MKYLDPPALACVVMSVNTQAGLFDAVCSLLEQDEILEIVVVNSGSGAPAHVLGDIAERVTIVNHREKVYAAAARNLGIRATTAPFVSFLAADCIAAPGWAKGRVAAHRDGARLVSSAIDHPNRKNIWSVATNMLLFPRRLVGTPDQHWLHYGLSYDRSLFDEFGYFDETLRAGEDTEFGLRIINQLDDGQDQQQGIIGNGSEKLVEDRLFFRANDVITLHENPTRFIDFIKDQYNRGQRSVKSHLELGLTDLAQNFALKSFKVFFSSTRTYFQSVSGMQRYFSFVVLPFAVLGRVANRKGAIKAFKTAGPEVEILNTEAEHTKIPVLLQVRNGMRYLPGLIKNIEDKISYLIVLDDGSTDGTREYLENCPLVKKLLTNPAEFDHHVWNEKKNKARLIQAASELDCDWVIALDVDERLAADFSVRLTECLKQARDLNINAFYVHLKELWNDRDYYRVDGIWGSKLRARLFRITEQMCFDKTQLHGHWAPTNYMTNGMFVESVIIVYHISMIREEDRENRIKKYETIDPDCRWQRTGYRYLNDPKGLLMRRIPESQKIVPPIDDYELQGSKIRLIALLVFHNEARFLQDYMDNVGPQVDGILALDDGSTDGSAEIIKHHPKLLELIQKPVQICHQWNEVENHKILLDAVSHHDPQWLMAVDADERLERSFRRRVEPLIHLAEQGGTQVIGYNIREIWDQADQYRSDGYWARKSKANLFKYRADHEFDTRPLHSFWAPLNSINGSDYKVMDLNVYHIRMLRHEDRLARYQRYKILDPEEKWQKMGYEYLIDESGLSFSPISTYRDYGPKPSH